ncbi:MAG: protein kinase [Polyangiaceae bacterium]
MKVCPQCKQRYPHESSYCFADGSTLEAMPDPRLGTTIAGRYVLEEILGEGGMATVFRARHKLVDRPVAIKLLHAEVVRDATVKERFRREAVHAQRLAHANIIEVFDHGETEDGTAFLVMELLEGQSLANIISTTALPVPRVLKLAVQMARALARAHDFEVIHRDLKPENVFVMAGDRVKLLDFGIARSMHDSRLTSVGEIFGTPEYMAPEQGTSTEAGPSADIYSLGVMLFEMVTGTLPFEAPNAPTLLVKHMHEPQPHMRDRVKTVPASLDELVYNMMGKMPADRPFDAQTVVARLLRIAEELDVEMPGEPEAEVPPPSRIVHTAEAQVWDRRTKLFESMLKKAFAGAAPSPELLKLLEEVKLRAAEVASLRGEAFAEQQKLEVIEQQAREGKARFGQAMDTLTSDASRLREEERDAQAQRMATDGREFPVRLRDAHKEAVFWEGRSGFAEPYLELSRAYRDLASIVEEWYASRQRERLIADLDYQIRELRTGLDAHNADIEARRVESHDKITRMGQRTEQLEATLFGLAERFCAPLRTKPELQPLFRDLEIAN